MLWAVRAARALCGALCLWLNGWRRCGGRWCKLHSTIETRDMLTVCSLIQTAYIEHVNSRRWLAHSPRCVVVRLAVLEAWYVRQGNPMRSIEYVVRYELEVLARPNYTADTTDFQEVFQ